MTTKILGPTSEVDLTTVLDRIKRETMYAINCVMIGQIESYSSTTNLASIKICFKKKLAALDPVDYPVIHECPVFILSGGDSCITMPIDSGDECIVLFNDRNFDNWLLTGETSTPATTRCHDISDAIAIVGLRSKPNVKLTPASSVCIDGANKKVAIKNDATSLITLINSLIDTLSNAEMIIMGTTGTTAPSFGPTGKLALNNLKTTFGTLLDLGST